METSDKKNNIEFVPFVHPRDSKGKRGVKQQVRSHVARLQHERSSRTRPVYEMQPWSITSSFSSGSNVLAQSRQNSLVKNNLNLLQGKDGSQEVARTNQHDQTYLPGFHNPLPPQIPAASTQEDPFWTYPIPYSSLSSRMIAYYIQCLTMPVPELDGPQRQGLLRDCWFPLALRCPASLYAILLVAASRYRLECEAASVLPRISENDILFLKGCALQQVNQTIRSSNMAISLSDAMIGAVAKLAVFEALFGDMQVFRRHMVGLSEMIALRQKSELATGALDVFVRRLVFWIDLNASYLTGMPRTFGGKESVLRIGTEIKEPNPDMFAGRARTLEMLGSGGA